MIYLARNPVPGTIHPLGWVRPTTSNDEFRLTSPYGYRDLNGDGDTLDFGEFHTGIDMGNKRCGYPVLAAAAGKVYQVGVDKKGANFVRIEHPNGMRTFYWHLATVSIGLVAVAAGKQIGTHGSTGFSGGCHLHFELWLKTASGTWVRVDPWQYLLQNITAWIPGVGSNIRKTAGTASSIGALYGSIADASIDYIRRADGANMGPAGKPRPFGGVTAGAPYTIGGVAGTEWGQILIDGAMRFVAKPLLRTSLG